MTVQGRGCSAALQTSWSESRAHLAFPICLQLLSAVLFLNYLQVADFEAFSLSNTQGSYQAELQSPGIEVIQNAQSISIQAPWQFRKRRRLTSSMQFCILATILSSFLSSCLVYSVMPQSSIGCFRLPSIALIWDVISVENMQRIRLINRAFVSTGLFLHFYNIFWSIWCWPLPKKSFGLEWPMASSSMEICVL